MAEREEGGEMLLADSPVEISTGTILIVIGLIAIGVASITIKSLSVELEPGQRWITRIVGGVVVVAGLYLVLTDSNAEGGPGPSTTTTATVEPGDPTGTVERRAGANEVVIDQPEPDGSVSVTCDAPDACWIPASGRVGEGTGAGVRPYLLIAHAEGGNEPQFYVQYDSTSLLEHRWTAQAYIEDASPGTVLLIQAVLVDGEIIAPPDDSGLLWEQAKRDQDLHVIDESDVIPVTVE